MSKGMFMNKYSNQSREKIPPGMEQLWNKLKGLGLNVKTPDRGFIASGDYPHDAAAFVSTEDVDGDGIVDIIRFNPEVVRNYFDSGVTPDRISAVDRLVKELKGAEQGVSAEEALSQSGAMLEEATKSDKNIYADMQKIISAYLWLAVTLVHEVKHLEGQGEKGEFHDEHAAEGVEPAARKKTIDALMKDLPEVLKRDENIMRFLKTSDYKVKFVKRLLKVSSKLDRKGEFDIADKIDKIVSEFLK